MPVAETGATFDPSAFLATCSARPGVYRMFDAGAKLLYVGKAKNLKKRLASYFRKTGLAPKTSCCATTNPIPTYSCRMANTRA